MGPCKICIVRACCNRSTECRPYKLFVNNASAILTLFSVMLAGILVGIPMIYLTEFYPDKEHAKTIIIASWSVCAMLNVTFSWRNLSKKNNSWIFEVFFGPFCTLIYSFMYIGAKIIKRA